MQLSTQQALMYAVDAAFHTTSTDPKDRENYIQTYLENINKWCIHDRMYIYSQTTNSRLFQTQSVCRQQF